MKNPKTVKAVVSALKWAADAMESGEIECTFISHEDHFKDNSLGGVEDSGLRTFTIRYRYIIKEEDALKELLDIGG